MRLQLIIFLMLFSACSARAQEDVQISLQTLGCYGICPVYTVTIFGEGRVAYVGKDDVQVTGSRTRHIPVEEVARLVERIEAAGFFELEYSYTSKTEVAGTDSLGRKIYRSQMVTDVPSSIIEVVIGGRRKRVISGFFSPPSLRAIQQDIYESSGIDRWAKPPPAVRGW